MSQSQEYFSLACFQPADQGVPRMEKPRTITSMELMDVTQNSTTTESYTYDPVGNRLDFAGYSFLQPPSFVGRNNS